MKHKIILSMIAFLLLINLSLVSAEMTLWSDVVVDETTDSVSHHSYYQYYDDIQAISRLDSVLLDLKRSIYAGRTNDVILWATIENMPYNTTNYTVNYCEYNVTHIKTDYDNEGNVINTTDINYGFVYSASATNTTYLYFELKNRDSLITDLRCYYNDSDYLYDESILFARGGIYSEANKCSDCEEYTLEELSKEIERTDEIIAEETSIYNVIQILVNFNFQLWLMATWLVKLGLVLVAIGLLFYGIYHLYLFLKSIEQQI